MNKANTQPKTRPIALLHNASRSLIIRAFVNHSLRVTRELSFKNRFVDHQKFIEGVIDLSNIVCDVNDRLIFQPGEEAFMKAAYFAGKRKMEPRMVYLLGTEYGLAVVHGRTDSYEAVGESIQGEAPTLHTTTTLRAATKRYLERVGKSTPSHSPFATDTEVLEWILSENFRAECAEQAEHDKANGVELGDGMKVFERKPFVPRERRFPQGKKPQGNFKGAKPPHAKKPAPKQAQPVAA